MADHLIHTYLLLVTTKPYLLLLNWPNARSAQHGVQADPCHAVPELCFNVISATAMPRPGVEPACRAVAVRGLAVLAWRHRHTLLTAPHLRSQRLHQRVLQCLEGARNCTPTGLPALLVASCVGCQCGVASCVGCQCAVAPSSLPPSLCRLTGATHSASPTLSMHHTVPSRA